MLLLTRLCRALALLALACPCIAHSAESAAETTVPKGDYAIARLELSAGLTGAPQKLFIGLRDGKPANLWFVGPIGGDQRINIEQSALALAGNALKGSVNLRTATGRGRPIVAAQLTLDLAVAGAKLSGTYELAMGQSNYKSGKGTASGVLDKAAPAADAIPPQASWASFWGTSGDMSAQNQPALIEDLAQARPVWRSEAHVPTGYGNAPDSRYFTRALITGNGGGGSSPVVAGGVVYMYFYVPSDQAEVLTKNPYWERTFKDEADFKKQMAAMNANTRETNWVLGHFRACADDHVVALDGATGATRWRTVLPQRSPNIQTHKHRGTSGVPLVAGSAIYVPNLASRLYALDAATGQLRWEVPAFDGSAKTQDINAGPHNPSPFLIGENLIWARGGQVYALDAASGKEKWKSPGGYTMRWSTGGSERLITLAGGALVCLDAVTGRQIWKQNTDLAAAAPLSAVIAGDILIASPPLNKQDGSFRYRGLRLSEAGAQELWQDDPIAPDENMPVTVAGGRAYLLAKQAIRVLDIATGKRIIEKKFDTGGPGSNAWLGVVGDRFLFLPEGQHGTAHIGFLSRDLNLMGAMWLPANTDTTAYNSQPVVYPVVDGRLILRGGDGIYCYDLRKP
jgi:hypothetical protein